MGILSLLSHLFGAMHPSKEDIDAQFEAALKNVPLYKKTDYNPDPGVQPLPETHKEVQSKREAILSYIKLHSPRGLSVERVSQAFPAWKYSTISARISEMYKSGVLSHVGIVTTTSGTPAALYAVNEEK